MKPDQKKTLDAVLKLLCAIAPEVEPDGLELATPLRQQVDLDSMDWLNFLVSLHQHFGVEIAESDYARLITLQDVVTYLETHRPPTSGPRP
jgi:acyl carrier protein